MQKLRDVELHMARDSDQARVWLSGLHDYGSLSATDKVRFSLLAHMALKANESFFLAHRGGRMSQELYKLEALRQAGFLRYPGFQAVWLLRKPYFHEAFQRWVDDTIAAAMTAATVPRHYQEEVVSTR